MCGIFGAIGKSILSEDKLVLATRKLSHRGPDSFKTKLLGEIGFGFARLSINDLSNNGDQPMSHISKKIHIVFNGELYNFQILRAELEKAGAKFFSQSDTEVFLNAYASWGLEKTLEKSDGMFAFCIYDEEKKQLYLARDRMGMKPLFYSQFQGGLVFSSEIKAILEYTGHRALDYHASLNPIFMTGLAPPTKTMFENVSQVQPGHFLNYDLQTKQLVDKEYFHLRQMVDPDLYRELDSMPEKKLFALYLDELSKSIDLHLISDAPLGSLFSAGLDSSLISALACKRSQKALSLYYFQSESQNDMQYPESFVKTFGGKLVPVIGGDQNYIYKLPKMLYHFEIPNKEEGPVLGNLCNLARKDGFKVLLTGDSADELFGGHSFHAEFLVKSRYFYNRYFNKLKRVLNKHFYNSFFTYTGDNPVGTHYYSFPPSVEHYEVPLNCLLYEGTRLKMWQRCLEAYKFIENPVERNLKAYALDEISYRMERFMVRSDRFGMMESIEVRTPFLHPNILKLAVNTPTRYFQREKGILKRKIEMKYLVREISKLAGVPKSIIYRPKVATPHNSNAGVKKLIKTMGLKRTAAHLAINEDNLLNVALNAFNPYNERSQYAFLATEVLIKLFIENQSHESITEEFKQYLSK